MREKKNYELEDLTAEQFEELINDWKRANNKGKPIEEAEEPNEDDLRDWIRSNQPCPATKRNGEFCGATTVSASGYCFAHDPESAAWRAMGGRAKSRKARARKKLRELGLDQMVNGLREVFDELQAAPPSANNARAMAKIADTVMKMTETAAEIDKESKQPWNGGWTPYDPM